jgi:hypothetical protein
MKIVLFIVMLFVNSLSADSFSDANKAYENGDLKKAHKTQTEYQVWQEGMQPKLISSEQMMLEKISYIHNNPIKRGYVDEAVHWRYSSARDYEGVSGLVEIERMW